MSPRQRKLVFGGVLPLVSVAVAGGAIVLATLASFGAFPRPAPAEVSENPRPEDLAARWPGPGSPRRVWPPSAPATRR